MAILTAAFLTLLGYLAYLAVHRLYFNPLARFPGPKLAALSTWYEVYYDVFQKGRFIFKIDELHAQYGPIVRITPSELHIKDSTFWDTLFVRYPKARKDEWLVGRFGNDTSMFTTCDAKLHAMRRGALNNMFSRRAILDFEDMVQNKAELLCHGLEQCCASGTVCNVVDAYSALTGDVISQYAFGFSYNQLESPAFRDNFHAPFMAMSAFGYVMSHFPPIKILLDLLPEKVVEDMNPALKKLLQLQKDCRGIIRAITKEQEKGHIQPEHPTVFHSVLDSYLPQSKKSEDRLGDEAQTVLGAGITTTAWALCNATYYILANREIHSRLREELDTAIPNSSSTTSFQYRKLERLPYLAACVREAIRISIGTSGRHQRLIAEPLPYGDWTIPPNTPVSMTTVDVLFDEAIFPNARTFMPERWLGDTPRAADGQPLDHYFVAFGKGPRSCLGINLAYMEVFVALAVVFRRFSLELYETDVSDVELAHDFMIVSPKLDSKGVRVTVSGVRK